MLGRHPVIDPVTAEAVQGGRGARSRAAGLAPAEDEGAAVQVEIDRVGMHEVRGLRDMDRGAVDADCRDFGLAGFLRQQGLAIGRVHLHAQGAPRIMIGWIGQGLRRIGRHATDHGRLQSRLRFDAQRSRHGNDARVHPDPIHRPVCR